MNHRTFQIATADVARIIQALDEIAAQAQALADGDAIGAARGQRADQARHTLETVSAHLDRIAARAREVDTLVGAVPDGAVSARLRAPTLRLRDAVTALVVRAYGAAADAAGEPAPAPRKLQPR